MKNTIKTKQNMHRQRQHHPTNRQIAIVQRTVIVRTLCLPPLSHFYSLLLRVIFNQILLNRIFILNQGSLV